MAPRWIGVSAAHFTFIDKQKVNWMLCLLRHGLLSLRVTGRDNTTAPMFPPGALAEGSLLFCEVGARHGRLVTCHRAFVLLVRFNRVHSVRWSGYCWCDGRDVLGPSSISWFSSHIDTPSNINLLECVFCSVFIPEQKKLEAYSPLMYVWLKAWTLTGLPGSSFTCWESSCRITSHPFPTLPFLVLCLALQGLWSQLTFKRKD